MPVYMYLYLVYGSWFTLFCHNNVFELALLDMSNVWRQVSRSRMVLTGAECCIVCKNFIIDGFFNFRLFTRRIGPVNRSCSWNMIDTTNLIEKETGFLWFLCTAVKARSFLSIRVPIIRELFTGTIINGIPEIGSSFNGRIEFWSCTQLVHGIKSASYPS